MSKRIRKKIPPGWVTMKQYHTHKFGHSQGGGCSMDQVGGFPSLPVIYAGLKAIKPFSKGKTFLNDNFSNYKEILPYKIADTILGIGKSLGFGSKRRVYKKKVNHTTKRSTIKGGAKKRNTIKGGAKRKKRSKK